MALVWSDIVKQAALSTTLAMAWEAQDPRYPARGAIHVRDAGFKGLVGHHPDTLADRGEESEGPHGDFDEDLHDESSPAMAPHEEAHLEEHGEPHEDYERRHNHAYEKLWNERHGEGDPDHHDDDLMDFASHHVSNKDLWKEKGTLSPVGLRHGVYATQSHVHPDHVDKFEKDPHAPTHRAEYVGLSSYMGDQAPMFVTHEGRLHAIEGHHRVAAALKRGDSHINGWHYNADHHGFPSNEGDDDDGRY